MAVFNFNNFSYNNELQVLFRHQQSCKIDPKVADLLNYFISHAGQVVSRDELLDKVWSGTIVSDNTISWSISQLRKTLGDDSAKPIFIQTLPKKGYVFIAQIEEELPALVESQTPEIKPPTNTNPFARVAIGSCALVITILIGFWIANTQKGYTEYKIGAANLLTSLDGLEEDGSVSEDGVLLVFRHKPATNGSSFQVYLKPLLDPTTFAETLEDGNVAVARISSQRAQNPYSLTADSFDYRHVIWGKDSYQLYAVRTKVNVCEIVEFTMPVSRDRLLQQRQIIQCDPQGRTRLAFDNKNRLLYFTDIRGSESYALQQIDIENGDITQLTDPDTIGMGDHFIDLNADRTHLLILRDNNWSETEFLSFEMSKLKLTKLLEVPSIYYSAYWGPKGQSFWYNWGNANVLRFELKSQTTSTLLQTAFGWNYNTHPISDERAVFSVADGNASDFLRWSQGKYNKTVTPFSEFLPTFSPYSGKLAFVSNQSGLPQIWMQSSAQQTPIQLSNLNEFKEFTDLSWGPDDVLLLGVTDGIVGAMDVILQTYQILYKGEHRAHLPRLSTDRNSLLFSAKRDDLWILFHHNLRTNKTEEIGEGYLSQWITDERVLFTRKGKTGLWQYDLTSLQLNEVLAELPITGFWQVLNDIVYHTTKHPNWGLYQTPLSQYSPSKLTDLPLKTGRQFSVNPIDNSIVLEDWRRLQSDLKIAPLQYH